MLKKTENSLLIRVSHSFILMITFLTRIPIPMHFEFKEEEFTKGFVYFPFVGGIIGGLVCIPFLFIDYLPKTVFPFLIIIVYLLVVGGLHIDGVSDVFDGVFSARKKERMLEIMEDSRVGAFGVIGLIIYFLGLYIGLFEVSIIENSWLYIFFMPILGRSIALAGAGVSRYAKKSGLGKSLIDTTKPYISFIIIMLLCGGAYFVSVKALISTVITIIIMCYILFRMHKILGGITGDVVGMIVEISQVCFLILVACID